MSQRKEQPRPRREVVPNYVSLKLCDELYSLLVKEAAERAIPMNELVAQYVAEHFNRPELGYVPRKAQGRKPWKDQAKQPA